MNSAQRTLIEIASVSQQVVNALTQYTGCKTVESFRLDRVVVGSRSILEILNKKLLLEDGRVDVRLADWLNSKEPQACLDTLNQMKEILDRRMEYGVKRFFKAPSHSSRTQDKNDEAIGLFQMHQAYFHFLLTTDVWNCERNVYQRSQASTEQMTQRPNDALDSRDFPKATRRKSDYTFTGLRESPGDQADNLKTILGRLDAWNCRDIHRRTLLSQQPDTCTWLPKTKEFKTWRKVKDSSLWLQGKAGAGKSVLAASVIAHLEKTLQDGELLVFFYCDFRNERSTNAAEVMRSILSQLLQHFFPNTIESKLLIDDLEKEGSSIVNDAVLLARYISRAAQHFSQQPICVIDALDECSDVETLLDAVVQVKSGDIRLFMTSRPLQVIKDGLSGLSSISLDQMNFEVAADIALHVERELDSHRRLRILPTGLKNEIGRVLCDEADGMFRWVHCQLGVLKQCMTAVQIRKTLIDLPSDLETTYSRILLRINENDWEVVRRALYWLVASFRPLELREILESLSIDVEKRVFDRDSAPVHGRALLDALGSLVTYDELTDYVTLSHASVKEYLMAESTHSRYPSYYIGERDAHTRLILLCMCYITAYLKEHQQLNSYPALSQMAYKDGTHTDSFDISSRSTRHYGFPASLPSKSYPLLAYVRSMGFRHLAFVNPTDRKVLHAIEAFQSDVHLHSSEWEQLYERFTWWPSPEYDLVQYILVAFAPAQLLQTYLGQSRLNPRDGTNPLTYAAFFGKMEHAKILLSKGARVEHKGWDLSKHRQTLPLEVATNRWYNESMVELFLDEGSPVPFGLLERVAPPHFLSWDSLSPQVALVLTQTDEFVEWAIAVADEKRLLSLLGPGLFAGRHLSEEEMEIIERRLIQVGCDPSVRFDELGLHESVCAGHISTVKRMVLGGIPLPPDIVFEARRWEMINFFLSQGSNIHAISFEGETLLHLVVRTFRDDSECLKTIKALVGAGCNPLAANHSTRYILRPDETLLHVAAGRGEPDIVKYVLSLNIPLPPDILLAASGYLMTSFLLDEGADVNAISADGNTVLHVALRDGCRFGCGHLGFAKLLVDAGCNPCLPNVLGETPLHAAARGDHLPVVQYLLSLDVPLPSNILLSVMDSYFTTVPMIKFLCDKGADVYAMAPDGDNLLHLAVTSPRAEEECLKIVEVLANAGCEFQKCNKVGESLIHVAARRRYTTILEYLFSLGLPVPSDLMLTQFHFRGNVDLEEGLDSNITRFLLHKGCDMCIVAENGSTLLHLAAQSTTEESALDLTKLLVKSGCCPRALNSEQESPFHIASRSGYISVISYFLSLGEFLPSDVLLAASTGFSNKEKMIRYLIQQGADIFASTNTGDTALHLVMFYFVATDDRLRIVKTLIEAGCDPLARDPYGQTPMHLAAEFGSTAIIEYLLLRGTSPPHDILLHSTAKTLRFFLGNGVNIC